MSARRLLSLVILAASLAASPALAAAEPAPAPLVFAVTRDGSSFGTHQVSFKRDGDRLIVETDIAFKVKIAFVTVFRYSMNAREEWRGDTLLRFESKTDSDGKPYFVRAEQTADGLKVESTAGNYIAPPGVLPFTFWNRSAQSQAQIINPERGRIEPLQVERLGEETLMIGAKPVPVEKLRFAAANVYDLVYERETGRWVGGSFKRRGFLIGYAPAQPVADPQQAAR
jgi:hypothetical protein